MFNSIYLGFKFAFSYFSILPVSFKESDDLSQKEVLNVMLLSLPLVGLTLGVGAVAIFSLLDHLGWYGAIITAILYMVLYGFLHTEAIMDVADGIYANHGGKDAYRVAKEPTVGAMGVLFGVGALLLKVSGIVVLLTHHLLFEFLSVLIISRLSLLPLIVLHEFKSSFLTQLKDSLDLWWVMMLFILVAIGGSFFMGSFVVILILGVILSYLISIWLSARLGFTNGDVLGATLEGVEILLFFLIALLMV